MTVNEELPKLENRKARGPRADAKVIDWHLQKVSARQLIILKSQCNITSRLGSVRSRTFCWIRSITALASGDRYATTSIMTE